MWKRKTFQEITWLIKNENVQTDKKNSSPLYGTKVNSKQLEEI